MLRQTQGKREFHVFNKEVDSESELIPKGILTEKFTTRNEIEQQVDPISNIKVENSIELSL